ncbi:MAG: TMAO reductase system periplasmic protein TorT [Desulfovibrio sp.]
MHTSVNKKNNRMVTTFILATVISCLLSSAICTPSIAKEAPWWPIPVKSYYGEYDKNKKVTGQASTSLDGPKLEEWYAPPRANRPYTIGVSFPHMKDSYWVAVNYGIIEEAKRLGVGVKLLEAGGYDSLGTQHEQVRQLMRSDVDGIVLGSISYSGNNKIVRAAAKKDTPVVEVINDVSAADISAKALVSFNEMGYFAGEFVAEHAEENGLDDMKIVFLPGPNGSGWAPETLDGFTAAMEFYPGLVDVLDVQWGDTGKAVQGALIRKVLMENNRIDYLVCNAVAAEVAPAILKELGRDKSISVVSTYIIPSLYDKISAGEVIAAPSDLTVFQGRMAVGMIVRLLNGEKAGRDFPFRSGPFIPMITPENISSYPYEGLFGPRDYRPVFSLEPK